nr:hypothetical protein NG677_03890 [Methylobacterium sp. OTU13CASTA1]
MFSAAQRPAHSVHASSRLPIGREAETSPTIAALYVQKDGCYANLPGVEVWDQARDARTYAGPHPVVCHSPCQRWGRFWHGSTRKPHQFQMGADDGCFAAALAAVRRYGGVLEHPANSHAWAAFDLWRPARSGGWLQADAHGGWTCYVEQGHYGHFSRKPTWLYAVGIERPELIWGPAEQRLHPIALERHGYAKARRIGMAAMIGGKDKTKIREATPPAFRDVLLTMAATALAPSLSGRA